MPPLPGPETRQLATYIGWLMHRTPSEPGFASQEALTRDFGSAERWRSEFMMMGKALASGLITS